MAVAVLKLRLWLWLPSDRAVVSASLRGVAAPGLNSGRTRTPVIGCELGSRTPAGLL